MPFLRDRWSQEHQRRYQTFRDQHDRLWGGSVEIKTGHPCTPLKPWAPANGRKWRAPLMPPQGYIRPHPTESGRVVILYDAWITELETAHKEYQRKCMTAGIELYREQFDPAKPVSPAVIAKVGPPPLPVEPVLAAKQGHPWVLGLTGPNGETPKMPKDLAPYFTKVEPVERTFAVEFETAYEDEPAEDVTSTPTPTTRGGRRKVA
jgi:hypothetical protein